MKLTDMLCLDLVLPREKVVRVGAQWLNGRRSPTVKYELVPSQRVASRKTKAINESLELRRRRSFQVPTAWKRGSDSDLGNPFCHQRETEPDPNVAPVTPAHVLTYWSIKEVVV